MEKEYGSIKLLNILVLVNAIGLFASLVQKVLTRWLHSNVSFIWSEIILKSTFLVVSLVYLTQQNSRRTNSLFVDTCDQVIDLAAEDKEALSYIFTFRFPLNGDIEGSIHVTTIVTFSFLQIMMLLEKSQILGNTMLMMNVMINEMLKFFMTISPIFILFFFVG